MSDPKIDPHSGVQTTGHEWDGVTELNNPMPRWWLTIFYACIAFAAVYVVFYPAIPLVSGATRGLLGYTARAEVEAKIAEHSAAQQVWRDKIAARPIETLREDPDLYQFAIASGAASFALNCSQCHGAGAAGNVGGFPNLNDDDWIWGGDLANIRATIAHGIRNADDPDARATAMPAFGTDQILTGPEIDAVVQHVLGYQNRATKPDLLAQGATLFAENCAACHGEDGRGLTELGGPNLTDGIWLYGSSPAEITAQIRAPRQGVMPAWGQKLDDATLTALAVYVHGLGGGI